MFPIFDTIDLNGVHSDTIFTNDNTKIFNLRDFKLALLQFEIEVIIG